MRHWNGDFTGDFELIFRTLPVFFLIEHVLLYRAQLTIQQATYFNVIGHVKSEPFKYISCDRFILTTLYLTLQKLERFVKISLRHSVKEFF